MEEKTMNMKEKKKDRSIRPAVLIVLLFSLVVIIAVIIPLQRHREFVRYMSDLSSMTSRAGAKEMVACDLDGETFTISSDAAYELYGKLVYLEKVKTTDPDETLATEGFTLTYGLLKAELTVAPAVYKDEEAVYVEYHSPSVDYAYIAPHLDYRDLRSTVTRGRLP